MTAGTGDTLFDQDGSAADDVEAPEPHVEPAPASPPDPAQGRPGCIAPTWLTGGSTSPWPPPEATEHAADRPAGPRAVVPPPRSPVILPTMPPRPRIVAEPSILGLSRLTRGRFGSRVFTLFFVFVFTLIVVQMIASILDPW